MCSKQRSRILIIIIVIVYIIVIEGGGGDQRADGLRQGGLLEPGPDQDPGAGPA